MQQDFFFWDFQIFAIPHGIMQNHADYGLRKQSERAVRAWALR